MADGGGEVSLGTLLFSFEGRINRGTFWKIILGSIVFVIGLGMLAAIVIPMLAGTETIPETRSEGAGGTIALLVAVLIYGAGIWISFASGAKRWHDLDKSGWLVLLNIIPVIGFFTFLYTGFAAGTEGDNRFGAAPS
jgi:uncharacterized membrane protein YhaH (DUF805 family)